MILASLYLLDNCLVLVFLSSYLISRNMLMFIAHFVHVLPFPHLSINGFSDAEWILLFGNGSG